MQIDLLNPNSILIPSIRFISKVVRAQNRNSLLNIEHNRENLYSHNAFSAISMTFHD